jgi:type VI secretion system protein ImpF
MMARSSSDAAVTLSLLDRLIDTEPRNSREAPLNRAQSVRLLKEAVRRDLEWLLNTRRIAIPPPAQLREVNRSVYIYGLPDFSTYSFSSPADRARLVRELQTVVKIFEPRIARTRIVPVDIAGVNTRTLHFRIDGLLLMDPAPEHISFDTVLQLTSGEYEVASAG